jgi:hypothetical protein
VLSSISNADISSALKVVPSEHSPILLRKKEDPDEIALKFEGTDLRVEFVLTTISLGSELFTRTKSGSESIVLILTLIVK